MGKLIRSNHRRSAYEERLKSALQSMPIHYQMGGAVNEPQKKNSLPPRRHQNRTDHQALTLPPEDLIPNSHILFTGGIGDFFVLESHMENFRKEAIEHVTLATRAHKGIRELLEVQAVFPNLRLISTLQADWDKTFCYVHKGEIKDTDLNDIQDWSIYKIFPYIESKVLTYQRSSYVTNKSIDVSRFDLPPNYFACNPYSPNDRRSARDFCKQDWSYVLEISKRTDYPIVVLNVSDDYIPESPSIINLNRKTSLCESVEVVKGASGYLGIDSCLSVIAAQCFSKEKLSIKSNNQHLYNYQGIYYAPHKHFQFITESF